MTQKWNLQDIRPPESKRERPRRSSEQSRQKQDIAPRKEPAQATSTPAEAEFSTLDIVDGGSEKKKRILIAVVIAVVIIGLGFLFSALMSGAEITVYPKHKDTNVQATFTAHKEPLVGELGYELLVLEANGERQVSATGEETVSERATGDILIYNEYSAEPQRLIKNTRFESPDGFVFRVQESVVVPGRTTDEDGAVVPGVVSAEVFADGTGEQYNIGPSTFRLPGLEEGSAQYDAIYAESTEGFSGGFEGSKFIIEESELQTAQQALHLELRNALLSRLKEEQPAGFVVYENAVTFTFDSLPTTEYGEKLATIKERGTLRVPIFKASEFASYLAENTIAGYEGNPVTVTDPYLLSFSYESSTTTTSDISTLATIDFNLNGDVQIVWEFDGEKLKQDVAGVSKTGLTNILSGQEYRAIERAEAVVRPFWAQSFPEDPTGIELITVVGEEEQ